MPKTRAELAREFNQQLYIAASFFKMKSFSEDPAKAVQVDQRVNNSVAEHRLQSFPHKDVDRQVIPVREPWPKMTNILRDPETIAKMANNSKRVVTNDSSDS